MAEAFSDFGNVLELSEELNTDTIAKLKLHMGVPAGICQEDCEATYFLSAMRKWESFKPTEFIDSLQRINRPDLVDIAEQIPWLCKEKTQQGCESQEKTSPMKQFLDLLRNGVTNKEWKIIALCINSNSKADDNFESVMPVCIDKGIIQPNMEKLIRIFKQIKRLDLAREVQLLRKAFENMSEETFVKRMKDQLSSQSKDIERWKRVLKQYLVAQYRRVKQYIGKDQSVSLERVYVELTIIKEEPRPIDLSDETTYSEIAYLRKIANKEVEIIPVKFQDELNNYDCTTPEIWCIIGNPGCGKTFLCKRTALGFGKRELEMSYVITIPCRHSDWHAMETTRHEEDREVDSEFMQRWLCLGMPIGSSWSNDLAKHLIQSDGEGLLLIIDGLDEFTKKAPFQDTFLCLLLTRQTLIRATIILTSRPGAWTVLSAAHELKVDRHYQVLGFSPENRDLYFQIQITNVTKLNKCKLLMETHDEMKQLSLIPVNASLFAALLKGEDSTSINTLTKLYYELVLYMIRRELIRMGLKEYSRVSRISNLHTDILACLHRIGFIAILGVANRDLASEETVTLNFGQEEYPCQCLGLAHEHYIKESVGLMKQVWTFVHLTMQEFVSALYLEHTTWTKQCYSVRYISHSEANFSLFRMVVRFLCGLLSDKAAAILSILYRYLTPQPIQLIDMPMSYQLDYSNLYHHEGWNLFSKIYFQLASILFETNSDSIPLWFNNFKQHFPKPVYLYVRESVSPNEWICFIQTLKLIRRIHLIYIDTSHINPSQFKSFVQEMGICFVTLFAMRFYKQDSITVLSYTDIIRESGIKFDTKISIELSDCYISTETSVNLFPTTTNLNIDSLRLSSYIYSLKTFQELTNQFSAIQCLYFEQFGTSYDAMEPALCHATQLRVLHLHTIRSEHIPSLTAVLPQFSKLQEIAFLNQSLLPAISHLSNLTYLNISDTTTKDTTLCDFLLTIISRNSHSLRGMTLCLLDSIGFNNWSLILNCLEFCTNLVQLMLDYTRFPCIYSTYWSRAVKNMKSLVELKFWIVSLYDTGLLSLCEGLIYHPAIRCLWIRGCELTSLSCEPLTNLIPTVSQLETLIVMGLSEPDRGPISLLKETADEFGIEHGLQ